MAPRWVRQIKSYGFAISGCIDGYSRKVIWLKVYTTNNDPKVIAGYYYEAITENGGCSRKLRGDLGTENSVVKQIHPNFGGQYLEGTSQANQRIEHFWGHVRKQCVEYWMIMFKMMQDNGDFYA